LFKKDIIPFLKVGLRVPGLNNQGLFGSAFYRTDWESEWEFNINLQISFRTRPKPILGQV